MGKLNIYDIKYMQIQRTEQPLHQPRGLATEIFHRRPQVPTQLTNTT